MCTCGRFFELNRLYGFTKFAIVVPSIAIKEGVNKSLEMMGDHFRALYSGVPFEHFIYDSARLGQVSQLCNQPTYTDHGDDRRGYQQTGHQHHLSGKRKTGGEAPIALIQATNPIVIVDEPQSVDGGLEGRGRDALARYEPAMHPALLGDPRGQIPHGVPAQRRGRLRAKVSQAD